MKRAIRRHHYRRMKKRAKIFMKLLWGLEDSKITKEMIACHANTFTRCSCYMCGNPRHSWVQEYYTIQEKKANINYKEQLKELEFEL